MRVDSCGVWFINLYRDALATVPGYFKGCLTATLAPGTGAEPAAKSPRFGFSARR